MRLARFEVRLPSGWEYREYWANHAAVPPQSAGSSQSIFTMTEIHPSKSSLPCRPGGHRGSAADPVYWPECDKQFQILE